MNESRPDLETLVRFALEECDTIQKSQVQRWLDANGGTQPELDRVRLLLQTLQTNESCEAPRELVWRIAGMMAPAAQIDSSAPWWEVLQSVIATLVFDGRATPMVAGYRGVGTRGHITYATNLAELDLELSEHGGDEGQIDVRGQIQAEQGRADEVAFVFLRDPDRIVSVIPDERGLFRLSLLPGAYSVHCRLGSVTMDVPEIHIE